MAKKKEIASKEEVVEAPKKENKSEANQVNLDGQIYDIKGDKVYKGDVEVTRPDRVAYIKSLA